MNTLIRFELVITDVVDQYACLFQKGFTHSVDNPVATIEKAAKQMAAFCADSKFKQ